MSRPGITPRYGLRVSDHGRLELDRETILACRRGVGALDERLPRSEASMRRAAWSGLQDSVPRAAVLSLHARIRDIRSDDWEHPSLVQLWGPRYSVFVVAAEDLPLFSLGTLPDDDQGRARANRLADALEAMLDGDERTYSEVGHEMGGNPNVLRYAGATGRVLIRWDGARRPTVRVVPPPDADPGEARLELARRWLHTAGPTTAKAFAWWAGISPKGGRLAFEALATELAPVHGPVGDGWILAADVDAFRAADPAAPRAVRLLSSGDPYLMAGDRELLVPDAHQRRELWPPGTVWPGGLLVGGELVGTWRRAGRTATIRTWRRITEAERAAVEAEAASLPLPTADTPVRVAWTDDAR
jgi:hypothetical protein